MAWVRHKVLLLIGVLFLMDAFGITRVMYDQPKERWEPAYYSMYGLSNFFKEAVYLHVNLFSLDTIKIMTAALPFYLSSRMVDETIQEHFYDGTCHKNKNQMPDNFTKAVEKSAYYGVILLSSMSVWGWRPDLRTAGRIFAIGALSGLCLKDVIKTFKSNGNLRPWNEHFSSKCRSQGGLPSGHMFEATYMATVYGLQYGKKAWIPLSLFSVAMFGVSVNANRHYVSQVVAGGALGIIYGVAASKTIDCSLYGDLWYAGLKCNADGSPQIVVARKF